MPKYAIEMDEPSGCLGCQMADDDMFFCHAENAPYNELHDCGRNSDGTDADGRPDWCPLESLYSAFAAEWFESVNSQPEKDEEKQTVRLELYESEWDKVGPLSLKYGLSTAQTIARLIEEAYAKEFGEEDAN